MEPRPPASALAENRPFRVEFRSALNGDLLTERQQEGPCRVGHLQCQLAAMFCDEVPPTLLFEGTPLASTDVLREEASLGVVRRTLPERSAFALQAARAAVSRVRSSQLQDLKSIAVPAQMMLDVMAASLSLLDHREHSWHSIKKLLSGSALPSRLIALQPHEVSFESQLAVQQLVEQRGDSFRHEVIAKYSIALAPFAALVRAFRECWAA
ncbi:DHC1B [Symbiodinium natans]|uniref:DHC1B protein n=1 Tax=Symbiodinium natans TaxID=878477 RepID=A0A812HH99_9DINO|nr:DHC1B [Symbiodinium natans]